ncbi:hypothetical protein BV25DRAFT_991099 [Artomyces pyxidatus]|uniref:Uncharacterized protein n=1 Tax=Artomyces pyxidatus TaxID=48021 RepID=A0ACB8SWF9_9AGAM|nr:hypothetical protein BV25DRAFT_991099 [Artomyces pyxidatus]
MCNPIWRRSCCRTSIWEGTSKRRSYRLSVSRPQADPSQEEQARTAKSKGTWLLENIAYIAIGAAQSLIGLIMLAEGAVTVSVAYPQSTWSKTVFELLCREKGAAIPIHISPVFVAGVSSMFLGATIRRLCFRELGKLFTYELAIRDKHKLVTSGPYSIVRHPSYTGVALVHGGMTACFLAKGMWLTESRFMQTVIGWIAATIWASVLAFVTFVILRARQEDAMLHKEFGKEWEAYSKRVPCRYIPRLV